MPKPAKRRRRNDDLPDDASEDELWRALWFHATRPWRPSQEDNAREYRRLSRKCNPKRRNQQ